MRKPTACQNTVEAGNADLAEKLIPALNKFWSEMKSLFLSLQSKNRESLTAVVKR